MKQKHVLITTSYRGVFYGEVPADQNMFAENVTLKNARNVLYWHDSVKGFLGLTEDGPNKKCKIGAKAGGPMHVRSITSITECSEKAIKSWSQV